MKFDNRQELEEDGFIGFSRIEKLFKNCNEVSNERGVYMILRINNVKPKFINPGTGGFFKGKNPNVSLEILKNNWVDNTIVLYIGQSGGIRNGKWSNETLFSRISTLMAFGQGQDVMHYGGRLIWQIKDANDLIVCWKPLPKKITDPKQYEKQLIQEFKMTFQGMRPFANLQD